MEVQDCNSRPTVEADNDHGEVVESLEDISRRFKRRRKSVEKKTLALKLPTSMLGLLLGNHLPGLRIITTFLFHAPMKPLCHNKRKVPDISFPIIIIFNDYLVNVQPSLHRWQPTVNQYASKKKFIRNNISRPWEKSSV